MDSRKTYVKPAVESEVMMEQTSLACNVIMYPETCADPLGDNEECIAPLFKGYNWDSTCTVPFPVSSGCVAPYS